jgi:hypothetical protein
VESFFCDWDVKTDERSEYDDFGLSFVILFSIQQERLCRKTVDEFACKVENNG